MIWLVECRIGRKVNIIFKDTLDTSIKLLRSLKRSEILAILIDQGTCVPSVFVDFFIDKAWTPSGLAVMALKTDTEVLVWIDCRIDEYRHKIIIKGSVIVESS